MSLVNVCNPFFLIRFYSSKPNVLVVVCCFAYCSVEAVVVVLVLVVVAVVAVLVLVVVAVVVVLVLVVVAVVVGLIVVVVLLVLMYYNRCLRLRCLLFLLKLLE